MAVLGLRFVRGLSLVVASGGHSSSQCAGLSLSRPLLLRSTGSRHASSVIVAHGPSRSAACGIFPDQGSNPCPLHRQADSQPLHHQGSPSLASFNFFLYLIFVSLINMCLGVFLLGFILYGTLCTSWTWVTISFLILVKFSAIISSNIFSVPSLSLFFLEPL